MKTILCYGDSNTWGYVPGSFNDKNYYMERYSHRQRWPSILQEILGNNYSVVEEGLNGRTTNVDYKNFPGRNGKTFLPVCLYSHAPLHLVILMLGINDLKAEFKRTSEEVTQGLSELIDIIQASIFGPDMQSPPKVLLIGYPIPLREDGYEDNIFAGAILRAKQFDQDFKKLAAKTNCFYFNVAPYITLSEIDGIHFDEKSHYTFAHIISGKIKEYL